MTDQELKEIRERWTGDFPTKSQMWRLGEKARTDIPKLLDEIERLRLRLLEYGLLPFDLDALNLAIKEIEKESDHHSGIPNLGKDS